MPVRAIVTRGSRYDSKEACALIDGINERYLLADRGYNSSHIIEFTTNLGTKCAIPPKKNSKNTINISTNLRVPYIDIYDIITA